MSELPTTEIISGEARKQYEQSLLQQYRVESAQYTLTTMAVSCTFPRIKQRIVNLGDGEIDKNYLERSYKFSPQGSIIGSWSYVHYMENTIRDRFVNWEDFVTDAISSYLKLIDVNQGINNERLDFLKGRVLKGDPLYEFYQNSDVKRINTDRGHLGIVLNEALNSITDSNNSELYKYFKAIDSPDRLVWEYILTVLKYSDKELKGGDTEILRKIVQYLDNNLDVGPVNDLLIECYNIYNIENARLQVNDLLNTDDISKLANDLVEEISSLTYQDSNTAWDFISKNVTDLFSNARIVKICNKPEYENMINSISLIRKENLDLANYPTGIAQIYKITSEIYNSWKIKVINN